MTHEIVPATEATLAEIESWLDAEEVAHQEAFKAWEANEYEGDLPPRGFRCNWDSVKRSWRDDDGRVDVLVVDGRAVGFLAGTDILEIRPDCRRFGYGKLLADFMLATAFEAGRSVVEIEIAPPSAEPFWRSMGFTPLPERTGPGGGIYAYRVLPRTFDLGAGERVPYAIEFFSEQERYSGDPVPLARYSGLGERGPEGTIQLPERAYCFNPMDSGRGDHFVRIELDGQVLHFDKAKYPETRAFGVGRDAGFTFFLDRIVPQRAT